MNVSYENRGGVQQYDIALFVVSFTALVLFKTFPLAIVSPSIGTHADTYYHSIIPQIIIQTGSTPTQMDLPYTSLPVYFILQAMIFEICGLNNIIISNNLLYLFFVVEFLIIYYAYTEIMEHGITSKVKRMIMMVMPYVALYLYYPTAAPHFYALLIYTTLLLVLLLSQERKAVQRYISSSLMTAILALSISLSHHLTQMVLLISMIVFITLVLILRVRSHRNIGLPITIVIIVASAFSYRWSYYFEDTIRDVLLELLHLKLSVESVILSPLRFPKTLLLLNTVKRMFMVLFTVMAGANFINMITKRLIQKQLDVKTIYTLSAAIGGLSSALVFGIAAERLFVYTMLVLTPFVVNNLTSRSSETKRRVGYAVLITSLASFMVAFTYAIANTSIGPIYVKPDEDLLGHVLIEDLRLDVRNVVVLSDFYMAEILKLNVYKLDPSTPYNTVNIYHEYWPLYKDSFLLLTEGRHPLPVSLFAVITERTRLRFYAFYGLFLPGDPSSLSLQNVILSFGKSFVIYSSHKP